MISGLRTTKNLENNIHIIHIDKISTRKSIISLEIDVLTTANFWVEFDGSEIEIDCMKQGWQNFEKFNFLDDKSVA